MEVIFEMIKVNIVFQNWLNGIYWLVNLVDAIVIVIGTAVWIQ